MEEKETGNEILFEIKLFVIVIIFNGVIYYLSELKNYIYRLFIQEVKLVVVWIINKIVYIICNFSNYFISWNRMFYYSWWILYTLNNKKSKEMRISKIQIQGYENI